MAKPIRPIYVPKGNTLSEGKLKALALNTKAMFREANGGKDELLWVKKGSKRWVVIYVGGVLMITAAKGEALKRMFEGDTRGRVIVCYIYLSEALDRLVRLLGIYNPDARYPGLLRLTLLHGLDSSEYLAMLDGLLSHPDVLPD